MKKARIILTMSMVMCLLTACGGTSGSGTETTTTAASETTVSAAVSETVTESVTEAAAESSETTTQTEAENAQSEVLYAVFAADDVREYPVENTGAKKTAEELAAALTELTGLDFTVTVTTVDEGLVVDWSADSTLVAGLDDREQKEEFHFFDNVSLNWFMMDSLCHTLTENLGVEIVYYTMDGGKELVVKEMPSSAVFPVDVPYMGSEFYEAHDDVKGDGEFARTKGLWRLDGETDAASIEMDGEGGFTMYYASGSVEASGYIECVDEYDDGSIFRYDLYNGEGEFITGFYFDSDTQIHMGNDDGAVYKLDTQVHAQADYQGFWVYPEGVYLEISGDTWKIYAEDKTTKLDEGPVQYEDDAAYLMNADGSSGGGKVNFDENYSLVDGEIVLTYMGESLNDNDETPKG